MNYLVYGEDSFLLEHEIDQIIKKHSIEEMSIAKFDLSIHSLKIVLEDLSTISLFDEKKLVIASNALFFNRGKLDDDIELLEAYLNNPNPESILIFVNPNPTIDNTKKITKLIKTKGEVIEPSDLSTNKIVSSLFKGYQIDENTINHLIETVGDNLSMLEPEINKLKTYKSDELVITTDDIKELSTNNIDTDIFKFIDHIISKEKNISLPIYEEMIKMGEEPIKIIALLASKLRLMYQATELTTSGYSQQDISNTLGVHIYPVKLAINAGLKYDTTLLLKYMRELSELDIQIKTGKVNPVLGLELFILNV